MNIDSITYASLLSEVEELKDTVTELSKTVNRLLLENGTYVPANDPITPGIATKFAYDKNGLVISPMTLESSDIPELSIEQVSGLKAQLDSSVSVADLKALKSEILSTIPSRSTKVDGTGCKINYDANGYVISDAPLLASDIPTIPMSKVDGLPDLISIIESLSTGSSTTTTDTISVKAGTYTKVAVDSIGRVTYGSNLTLNDMPTDLLSQINEIASTIPGLASQTTMDSLMTSISKKVDANDPITPGTYTKVKVDTNGLVTDGSNLEASDLPEITIDMVTDLKSTLNNKADYSDVVDINNALSMITNNLSAISEIRSMETELKGKADADSVDRMTKEFGNLEERMEKLQEVIPNDTILLQLDKINAAISSLEGRMAIVEAKILQ